MPKEAKKAVEGIAKISGINAVYLFGSYAKGTQRPYSDIDLCVITDKVDEKTKDEILRHSKKKIEIFILDDLPLYAQFRVFMDGKPLLINSKDKLLEKRLNVGRLYRDFRPRLERYTKIQNLEDINPELYNYMLPRSLCSD